MIAAEYEKLRPFIPDGIESVLDVGCGDGGMSAMLALHNGVKLIHLLDGESGDLGPKRTSYSRMAPKPWRSTDKAVKLITASCPGVVIKTYTPSDEWPEQVDLIISLWSWGFHYPVNTYLENARRTKAPLLLDIRDFRWRQATFLLKSAGYRSRRVVDQGHKATRAIFYRKRMKNSFMGNNG